MHNLKPQPFLTLADAAQLAGYPSAMVREQREREADQAASAALHDGYAHLFGACMWCGEPVAQCACEPPEAA